MSAMKYLHNFVSIKKKGDRCQVMTYGTGTNVGVWHIRPHRKEKFDYCADYGMVSATPQPNYKSVCRLCAAGYPRLFGIQVPLFDLTNLKPCYLEFRFHLDSLSTADPGTRVISYQKLHTYLLEWTFNVEKTSSGILARRSRPVTEEDTDAFHRICGPMVSRFPSSSPDGEAVPEPRYETFRIEDNNVLEIDGESIKDRMAIPLVHDSHLRQLGRPSRKRNQKLWLSKQEALNLIAKSPRNRKEVSPDEIIAFYQYKKSGRAILSSGIQAALQNMM